MRSTAKLFAVLLIFLSACIPANLPLQSATNTPMPSTIAVTPSAPTHTPTATAPAALTQTPLTPTAPALTVTPPTTTPAGNATPTELLYTQCGWVWATQNLPQLNALLKQSYQAAGMPQVEAAASAYGENCMDQAWQVNHFSAMETDFNLVVPVADLKDTKALGDWIVNIMTVIEKIPQDQLAGPNPGRISIQFKGSADMLNMAFPRTRVEQLVQQGISGSALYDALKNNP